MMRITIILTFNEELHIQRCMENCQKFSDLIYVVDSYSTDHTCSIAESCGAKILSRKFDNQSNQFNWALTKINANDHDWIIRCDADETFDDVAVNFLQNLKLRKTQNIKGYKLNRRIKFQGEIIRFGGIGSKYITRVFQYGFGKCDGRLMDEHLEIDGKVSQMPGVLLDNNLNSLDWWMKKHVVYAEREALSRLHSRSANFKKYLYYLMPSSLRPYIYYFFRIIFLLGFLDRKGARQFHFLQAFVYRSLVENFTNDFNRKDNDYYLERLSVYDR